jgi:hypothetical protein
MSEFLIGLSLGIVLGWLTLGSYVQPAIGRICARLFAVVAISSGVGFLVWGIIAQTLRQEFHPILGYVVFTQTSEVLALGSGLLLAGIVTLVLSFVGRKRPVVPVTKREEHPSKVLS